MKNEPAYPLTEQEVGTAYERGLTKRELFAAMAMQGFCVKANSLTNPEIMASDSLRMADALIKALEAPNE